MPFFMNPCFYVRVTSHKNLQLKLNKSQENFGRRQLKSENKKMLKRNTSRNIFELR